MATQRCLPVVWKASQKLGPRSAKKGSSFEYMSAENDDDEAANKLTEEQIELRVGEPPLMSEVLFGLN